MSSEVCSVCLESESKYTCPACESKTCSLDCVKKHKLRTECTGAVDPTKFIPNKDLGSNGSVINRDYNYLLNFERKITLGKNDLKENAKQVFKRNFNQGRNNKRPRYNEPLQEDPRLALVRNIFPNVSSTSIKRENTLVIHLPPGMSRSNQNKSGYDKKSSSFTWTVEWTPLKEDNTPFPSFISFRLKESSTLKEAVPLAILSKSFGEEVLENNLHFYIENCVSCKAKKPSLIPLKADDTLTVALKDKIVLEFPHIYISLSAVTDTEILSRNGYGNESESDEDSDSSDTDSDGESDSDSDSDSDSSAASTDNSDSDSDEAPEEESSKAPQTVADVNPSTEDTQ